MSPARRDGGRFAEGQSVAAAVKDRDAIQWMAHGHVDKFDRGAIAVATRAFLGDPAAPPDAAFALAEKRMAELATQPPQVFASFLRDHPELATVDLLAANAYTLAPGDEPKGDQLLHVAEPYESIDAGGNLLTTAGLNRVTSLIIGGGGQAWNNANSRLGVGDDATAAAVGNTDLTAGAGATHRQFVVSDATYPQQSNGVITERATHTTGLSNFHWQEWGIDNGTSNSTTVVAVLLNHKVTDLGTKTSAASWVFTVTITLT